jgi:hypothetical protein
LTGGDVKQKKLAEALGTLVRHSTAFQEKIIAAMARLRTQLNEVQSVGRGLRTIVYVVAGLVLVVLWRLR